MRAARRLGVGADRLRRADLLAPTRGARGLDEPADLAQLAAAFQAGLAERTAFSHLTAALLWGLPIPRALQGADTLDVMTWTRGGQVVRPGCRAHRGLERRAVESVGELRVTSPADTWCDLADLGRRRITTDDLVVLGDAVVRLIDGASDTPVRPGARTSLGVTALHRALAERVRPRGAVMLRQALALIRPRVASPMETRSRLMFVQAGFPEPAINLPLLDQAGGWLAEGDLVWRRQQVVAEYQGAQGHGSIEQRSADAGRQAELGVHGWRVGELFAADVFTAPRRQAALRRFATYLDLDPRELLIA